MRHGLQVRGRQSTPAIINDIINFDDKLRSIRLSLNYKKVPYKTVNLEYVDLESEFVKFGIPATSAWLDGRPPHTRPAIFDPATNTGMADSYKIALYLDKVYPDTPKLFPPGTEALQAAFYVQYHNLVGPVLRLASPKIPRILNPASIDYYIRTRSSKPGEPSAEVELQGQDRVDAWKKVGALFHGRYHYFADFVVVSMLYTMEVVFGEDSEDWKNVMKWNNRRWAAFKKSMDQYATMG